MNNLWAFASSCQLVILGLVKLGFREVTVSGEAAMIAHQLTVPRALNATQPRALQACTEVWGKCNGKGFRKRSCCDGSECVKQNDWYSQCLPTSSNPVPVPKPRRPKQQCNGCSCFKEQCGGQGYQGPTCCEPGSTCTVQNRRVSKCVPDTCDGPQGKKCTCLHGKCGGKSSFDGWTYGFRGVKCCETGSTCVKENEWYSQCRPE